MGECTLKLYPQYEQKDWMFPAENLLQPPECSIDQCNYLWRCCSLSCPLHRASSVNSKKKEFPHQGQRKKFRGYYQCERGACLGKSSWDRSSLYPFRLLFLYSTNRNMSLTPYFFVYYRIFYESGSDLPSLSHRLVSETTLD
jgi:hypothetical protein